MSIYLPPWENNLEPNQTNVRAWMDGIWTKYSPMEQARWNQANINTLFYAGAQQFINRFYNFNPGTNYQQWHFNIMQQPVNLVTGFERQHRKGFMYQAVEGGDDQTTDQFTKVITSVCNNNISAIHEQKSKAKELAAVAGLNFLQPYLDFNSDDNAQGTIRVKNWEYNSFIIDPFARDPGFADANHWWTQEYITRGDAERRFHKNIDNIRSMSPIPNRNSNFYFLPENYNLMRNDLMILSHVWYKWTRKKKRLYSDSRNQFFDFTGNEQELQMLVNEIDDLEEVTVEVPSWKVAIILNDQLIFQGHNPLGLDEFPAAGYYWNYEPHQTDYGLRDRSMIYAMRSPQFLFNHKVITNNDIAAATINSGYKRMYGAVANEDNLKKANQGYDIVINQGYQMTDVEKIIPTAVPESDLNLAEQMRSLVYEVCGVNMENWAGQQDKQISALTAMMKQAANLLVFQKFFDQWDYADRVLGYLMMQIVINNWNEHKVRLLINEDPSPFFYSKMFSRFQVTVEEADLTPTQQNLQAQQMLEINERFGREVFPPSMIIPKLNITGKGQIIPYLQQQEQQAQQIQSEQSNLAHAQEEAKLQELVSKSMANLGSARERHGRAEADIGLLEERLSEISKNQSLSTKAKMEALEKMVDVINKFGEVQAILGLGTINEMADEEEQRENVERSQAKQSSDANKFLTQLLGGQQLAGR